MDEEEKRERLEFLWEYYEGILNRQTQRVSTLRSQNATFLLLQGTIFSILLATVFFLRQQGWRLLPLTWGVIVAFCLANVWSFYRSKDNFDLRAFKELEYGDERFEDVHVQEDKITLLKDAVHWARKSIKRNGEIHRKLANRHSRAFTWFKWANSGLLVYIGGRGLWMLVIG